MAFDKEKFKALMHYVIWKAGDKEGFGAIKLYKVLWFSEARFWVLNGYPIAGETYVRKEFGPVPKHRKQVRRELVEESRISERKKRYSGDAEIWHFKSLATPDVTALSKDERQMVDYWIKYIDEEHTGASISEESHDYAWEIAAMDEELPFEAFLANRIRKPTPKELARAKQRAKRAGLI